MKVDHVTAIVSDGRAAARALALVLGSEPAGEVSLPGMHVTTFRLGDVELHVNTPTADGPVAEFLRAHGAGLHHVALAVSDLDATIEALALRGVGALGSPIETAPGLREVFVDPRATGGILLQLVERRRDVEPGDLIGDAVDNLAKRAE